MAATKSNRKSPAPDWRTPGIPDELSETDQLAHAIVTERRDVLPSVERIMSADLDPDARTRALTLFSNALQTPGDIYRDPRLAIEHCASDSPGA